MNDIIDLRLRDGAQTQRRLTFGAGKSAFEHVGLGDNTPYEFALTGASNYIALHDIIQSDGEISVGGASLTVSRDLRRTITFVPAGVPVTGWSKPTDRAHAFVALYFDRDALPEAIQDQDCWSRPQVHFRSSEIEKALLRMKRSLADGGPYLPLLAETLTQLILIELAQQSGQSGVAEKRAGALSAAQVRAVESLMEDQVAADLSLDQLAAVVGLSRHHFLRSYKAATGKTPYRALLDRKIERSKSMLASGASVGAVAQQLGYASVADFSRAFSRATGIPPSRFRGL